MQIGKEFVRQNSFYKCVINDEDGSLDSADVFEVRVVVFSLCCFSYICVLEDVGWGERKHLQKIQSAHACVCFVCISIHYNCFCQ